MERRRNKRIDAKLPCDLLVDGLSHGGVVRDISPEGMAVLTTVALDQGTSVIVTLEGPARCLVSVEAMVWSTRAVSAGRGNEKSYRVGLVVLDAGDDFQQLVQGLAHRRR